MLLQMLLLKVAQQPGAEVVAVGVVVAATTLLALPESPPGGPCLPRVRHWEAVIPTNSSVNRWQDKPSRLAASRCGLLWVRSLSWLVRNPPSALPRPLVKASSCRGGGLEGGHRQLLIWLSKDPKSNGTLKPA